MSHDRYAPLKTLSGRPMAFWITLARSVLATALGLALILQPERRGPCWSISWACSG